MMKLSMVFLLSLLLIASLVMVGCDDSSDFTPAETTHITSTPEATDTPSPTPAPEPSPEPTEIAPQEPELKLTQGQVMDYVMSTEEGGEFGDSRYEVISEDVDQDTTVYTIRADLEMASTCPVTPTTGTATLQVDQSGIPISYEADYSVGKGWTAHKQSVDCRINDNVAHITWTVDEVAEEKDVPLTEGTFLFDPNLIGWFDLIYDVLELELGSSIEVPVLSPSDLEARVITIAVRPQLEEIEVGGVMLQAFVCDLTLSGKQEIHYVLLDGTLLRIERPTEEWLAKSVTIERVS